MGGFYQNQTESFWIREDESLTFPAHFHESAELVLQQEGLLRGTVDGTPFCLHPGGILFVFPNRIHRYDAESGEKHLISAFHPSYAAEFRRQLTELLPEQPLISAPDIPKEALWLLTALKNEPDEGIRRGYLTALTGLLLRQMTLRPCDYTADLSTAQQVIRFCQQHYAEPLSLEELSARLNISKFHISHLFSEKIGQSLTAYLHALRLEHAAALLRETERAVTEIALDCGFESVRTFNRTFRALYGVAPREWRE